jgi:hypothetical protein
MTALLETMQKAARDAFPEAITDALADRAGPSERVSVPSAKDAEVLAVDANACLTAA